MKIADGVEMLEISGSALGKTSVIYPALFWDNNRAILVDTGFPGQLPQIKEAIDRAGVPFERLDTVILTHHDIDHIGGAGSILKESAGKVRILAHESEEPYVNGEKTPLKIAKLEENIEALPEDRKPVYQQMKLGFQNSRVDVDKTLKDGEELPYCGGIRVIFTPGHTLGHICLYHRQSKTLVTGDALTIDNGRLVAPNPSINHDTDMSMASLKKLADYHIDNVICYHGGLFCENVNRRLREIISIS